MALKTKMRSAGLIGPVIVGILLPESGLRALGTLLYLLSGNRHDVGAGFRKPSIAKFALEWAAMKASNSGVTIGPRDEQIGYRDSELCWDVPSIFQRFGPLDHSKHELRLIPQRI